MFLSGKEDVFHRYETRLKAENVAQVNVEELLEHLLKSSPRGWSDLKIYLPPHPDGDSKVWLIVIYPYQWISMCINYVVVMSE